MSYYDEIFEEASDNFGLITAARAQELGIPRMEVVKLASRGKLERIGHGVYRIKHHVPSQLDVYADAVALVGEGSYVFGESVLAMHGLASVNPNSIMVATSKRVRKSLPEYVQMIKRPDGERVVSYEGIPSSPVVDAIRSCMKSVMPERLQEAVRDGFDKGLLNMDEAEELEKEIADA